MAVLAHSSFRGHASGRSPVLPAPASVGFISPLHLLLSEPRIHCWELFEHFFLAPSCIFLLQLKKVMYRFLTLTPAPMKAERASRERR